MGGPNNPWGKELFFNDNTYSFMAAGHLSESYPYQGSLTKIVKRFTVFEIVR